LKKNEEDVQAILKRVNELAGIKESDTGLAPPALWDLAADKQILSGTLFKYLKLILFKSIINYIYSRTTITSSKMY
jgi:hypothetical protein